MLILFVLLLGDLWSFRLFTLQPVLWLVLLFCFLRVLLMELVVLLAVNLCVHNITVSSCLIFLLLPGMGCSRVSGTSWNFAVTIFLYFLTLKLCEHYDSCSFLFSSVFKCPNKCVQCTYHDFVWTFKPCL